MRETVGLGRVAVVARGDGARRVLRALRELVRAGQGGITATVAVLEPGERQARIAREADETVERSGSIEDALRAAHADTAWLGPAPLAERAAFAEACARLGIAHVGPTADVLRRLAAPGTVAELAERLGVGAAPALESAPHAHLVEVVAARDAHGTARAIGVGDASLRLGAVAVRAESPAPVLSGAEDAAARELAARALGAIGWVGVGAVALVFDGARRELSLSGVDAFAQAAPAVEAVSAVDLVRLALQIAAGTPLDGLSGALHGHAIAARILAQDPREPGARAPARVELVRLPSGLGVRCDAAVDEGDDAPGGDEDVLATVVARGSDRADAGARLEQAVADTDLLVRGRPTGKAWLLALCARPEVRAGEGGLGLVARLAASGEPRVAARPEAAILTAAIVTYEAELDLERARFLAEARRGRPRVGPASGRTIELAIAGHHHRLEVRQIGPDVHRIAPIGGAAVEVRVDRLGRLERRLSWAGRRARVLSVASGLDVLVEVDGIPHLVRRDPSGIVTSPMPAVVVAIPVEAGQRVEPGDPVARIESMKVETQVTAPAAGVVREVLTVPNAHVEAGSPLVRLEPAGELPHPSPEPISLAPGAPAAEAPAPTPRDRYLAGLEELRRLLLGFDVPAADARRLAARWRDLAAPVPGGDPAVLRAEEEDLSAFADVHALFRRTLGAESSADTERRPPLEELWRYLHEPEARGAGLSPGFVQLLGRALSHYGLSLDEPGRALELALLRMQKVHERADEQLPPVLALLERRLGHDAAPSPGTLAASREVLDRLVEVGQERFPALADLAREVRFRRFDQPQLERIRTEAYAQSDADLRRLTQAQPDDREALVRRLVDTPIPMATLLVARMNAAAPGLRPRLVETLLRRYYRTRPLQAPTAIDLDGLPCAWADYDGRDGRRIRVLACFSPIAEVARAARGLARLSAEVPPDREIALELYLWSDTPLSGADAFAELLRSALAGAPFPRPVLRAAAMAAIAGRGLGPLASQQHATLRGGGPEAWIEDRRFRGVHPMLSERLQLGRLSRFELERLPSVEDVYLYHAVAKANPKDERLFAMAEVRDVTPVRDAAGRVVQLPQLERMFHEALAGMRRFQAKRAPNQRLEWNRVLLTVAPQLEVSRDELRRILERLAPTGQGLGLEMVLLHARIPDPAGGEPRESLVRVVSTDRHGVTLRWDAPTDRPLEPLAAYHQRVVQLRRRGLTHPYEIARALAPSSSSQSGVPPGEFVEHDLDASGALEPVDRPPGSNTANLVVGLVRSFTPRYPEGMTRVVLLGDPSRAMGALAEPECRRVLAALELAEARGIPLDWFAVSAGAKISLESGTENMDWISRVLRRIVEHTQRGGEINVVVTGINVGAQPYWNAEATMLMHTRGILVMTPRSSMVLTGKEALDYSGTVSAEDNEGIGGYDRIMGPNGQAQYQARSLGEAIQMLMRHHEHCYVAPGERFPRRAETADARDRDVRAYPHGPAGGAGFETVGDVFSPEKNPERKKPFEIRRVMAAAIDQDHAPLERWRDLRGGDTAVVWDAHLGGWPVCLIGIESRPLPRLEFVPADGPEQWSGGTLFPQSSKKIARAVNAASGNRPVVVLANLSGFDGSPESMRRLQLEYGAEIGRAVVNFDGPIVFCVVSRYHGGAFVVFSKTLRDDIEVVAVEGARASVIGGAPAAATVFAREVEARTRKDPAVQEAERAAAGGGAARARLAEVLAGVRSRNVGEVAEEFDRIHTVERALRVGSLDRIISAAELRPYLVDAVERGIARTRERAGGARDRAMRFGAAAEDGEGGRTPAR